MEKVLEKYSDNFLPNENFVFLEKLIYVNKNEKRYCDEEDLLIDCSYEEYATGSAIAISHDKDTLKILTVHHVCGEITMEAISLMQPKENGEWLYPQFKIIAHFYGKEYDAKIIEYDIENDICLLEIESEYAYKARDIKIASAQPKIGESVYSISSPISMHSTTTRFHFHGTWSGCDKNKLFNQDFCFYTIPAAPGSSGSGVFNKKGELVSLISITLAPFPEISAGPRQYYIESLLSRN